MANGAGANVKEKQMKALTEAIRYTTNAGQAGHDYIDGLCRGSDGTLLVSPPALPGTFRWEELLKAMLEHVELDATHNVAKVELPRILSLPEKSEVVYPEAGLKSGHWYQVRVSFRASNPIHRALCYAGAGAEGKEFGNYAMLVNSGYDENVDISRWLPYYLAFEHDLGDLEERLMVHPTDAISTKVPELTELLNATLAMQEGSNMDTANYWLDCVQKVEGMLSPEAHFDDQQVDLWAQKLKAKMARSREKGRDGWFWPQKVSTSVLCDMFLVHLGKRNANNFEDLGCILMMLSQRGDSEAALGEAFDRWLHELVKVAQHMERPVVPNGATHISEDGHFFIVPPAGEEDGAWGEWDPSESRWVPVTPFNMVKLYRLSQCNGDQS